MPKILNFLLFLAMGGVLLVSCGKSKSVSLSYTTPTGADEPDLIVIVQVDSELANYDQNLGPVVESDGSEVYFYGENADLRQCAVLQGFINTTTHPNFLSGAETANGCGDLGAFFNGQIFLGGSLDVADGLSIAEGYDLGSISNGFVFVLFFYNNSNRGAAT